MILSLCGLSAALVLLTGCVGGYTVGTVKPAEYEGIDTIYVPTFENDTLEPRLSALTTNAVISAIQQDGTYKIATESSADAVLRGKIRRIDNRQQRSANNQVLQTREMMVQVQINWYLESKTGERIQRRNAYGVDKSSRDLLSGRHRSAGEVTGRTSIFLDPNYQLSERQALALAMEDAAEQLVSSLSEGW
ncbi:MAG: LPS assembly lipoprotein LptE [Verrucomicrobiota bacterium]